MLCCTVTYVKEITITRTFYYLGILGCVIYLHPQRKPENYTKYTHLFIINTHFKLPISLTELILKSNLINDEWFINQKFEWNLMIICKIFCALKA